MKCQNCDHIVTRKSKYCPNCGTPIVARKSQHQQQSKTQIHFGYSLALVGLGIVIGLAIFKYAFNSDDKSSPVTSAIQTDQLIQSAVVLDIAQEFMCPCGSCNDALDECTCDAPHGAVEVRNFIAQKLQEGHKKSHIVEMVQEKYGSLKNQSNPVFKFETPK